MSVRCGAHDPSALVRRGHLPFAESAKGRKEERRGLQPGQLFCLRSWSTNLISSTTGS